MDLFRNIKKKFIKSDYKEWREEGLLHRDIDPAVIREDGTSEWYYKGRRHRLEGPAIINKSYKQYWINGELCQNREHYINMSEEYRRNKLKELWESGNKFDELSYHVINITV